MSPVIMLIPRHRACGLSIHFSNGRAKYTAGAELACLTCVRYSSRSIATPQTHMNSDATRSSRNAVRPMRRRGSYPHSIEMAVFDGVHEVGGTRARPWPNS